MIASIESHTERRAFTVSEREFALSPAQRRLWFLEQLHPGAPAKNLTLSVRLEGRLNRKILDRSLHGLVRGHQILRMRICNVLGTPAPAFLPPNCVPIQFVDFSEAPRGEAIAQASRRAEADSRRMFDIERGPLLRVALLRIAPEEHALCLTVHQLAGGVPFLSRLYRELFQSYAALLNGKKGSRAVRSFAAPVAAEANDATPDFDSHVHLQYWIEKLKDAGTTLDLPTDRPRPAIQSFEGSSTRFTLDRTLAAELKQLAFARGASLESLLGAAFLTLIHRWSGQDELLLGRQIAGARESGAGLRGNTLPLRADFSGEKLFAGLWDNVCAQIHEDEDHGGVPYETLLDSLPLQRDLSRPPLLQAGFCMEEPDMFPYFQSGSLNASGALLEDPCAPYELALNCREERHDLVARLQFRSELFDSGTVKRMAGHFQNILENVVSHPQQVIADIPMLGGSETHLLLDEWNETRSEYATDDCIHDIFARQAQRTPEAAAIIFGEERLAYAELNRKAGALARKLTALGVGPEVRVGVCLSRSPEMVIALYAIHKAGGAYVPMDPAYPPERLAFMLEDSQAPLVLTQKCLRDLLPATSAQVLCVDDPAGARENTSQSAEESPASALPGNLAYVIYTSGSTGKPKGVMVRHRNVVNFFHGMDLILGQKPGRWLAVTSISFDISVLELFWTLARGFTVILQPDEVAARRGNAATDPTGDLGIAAQILRHKVTHFQCTPSHAGMLAQHAPTLAALRRLKYLLLGGEALPPALAGQLAGSGEIINMYGPTETTVWSTFHRVARHGAIAIGRPIANTETYILDRRLNLVPVGVIGELFIGGDGVTRGYLNRPELTAERFLPDHFSGRAGARIYRTGDLARYRPDGVIEFMGRADHQVKVRGFRIEPGEIEAALLAHPQVRESAVSVWEPQPNDRRLVGYFVADPGVRLDIAELKRFLKCRLPDHMVPSLLVNLPEMPLTPNGKINRKALPMPEITQASGASANAKPSTPLEKIVAAVWESVLRRSDIGLQDDFFALGGNSMDALAAHGQVCSLLRRDLPLLTFFQSGTLGSYTRQLQDLQNVSN